LKQSDNNEKRWEAIQLKSFEKGSKSRLQNVYYIDIAMLLLRWTQF